MSESERLPSLEEIWLKTLNWQPSKEQQEQLQQLYQGIIEGNKHLNLTRITEPKEFWEKHLWDSLAGLQWFNSLTEKGQQQKLKVIDIGTGAGFPGLPVAVAYPHWQVTLLDSTQKKIKFLDTLIEDLGLTNVNTVTARVENLGHHPLHRHSYDLALIRAVAEPSVCAEYVLPLLKPSAHGVLYRGHWSQEDTQALQVALEVLNGNLESIEAFTTPLSQSSRHCLIISSLVATPSEFPRPVGVAKQKPL